MTGKLTRALTGLALLFCIRGQSQTIEPTVLNAAGGYYKNPSMYTQFEWSFGELMLTDTYTSSAGTLTNGVLQPYTDKGVPDPNIFVFAANEYKLFPNVTAGPFELDFFLNVPGRMELQLTDGMGRIMDIRSFDYNCCNRIERYDLSRFSNGVYFINATFTPASYNPPDDLSVIRKSTFRVVKGGR